VIFLKQSLVLDHTVNAHKIPAILDHICQRCGGEINNTSLDDYFRYYCRDCEGFGRVVEGTYLYRFERVIQKKEHVMNLKFELSEEQKKASQFLLNSLKSNHEGYLYAVCGAGKTEILYETIFSSLQMGYKICLAIPRTDVVKELTKRFIPIFPKTVIHSLYRDEKIDENADILISTVHQLIHYYHEFDLMIIDEADAFPYKNNLFLERLVKRALKPEGCFIMMSATYEDKSIKSMKKARKSIYRLPARYHRHQLDHFRIVYTKNSHQVNQSFFDNELFIWIEMKIKMNISTMIFVPTIEIGKQLEMGFRVQGIRCLNVSSVDQNRNDKIKQFREGKILTLITTTLLERGITIKGVDVGIINANHSVFNRHTLIQIAGRVGRHIDFPNGEIVLFTSRINREIKAAKAYIVHMNREASKRGLLDHDL